MKANELMIGDLVNLSPGEANIPNYVMIHAIKYDNNVSKDYVFDIVFLSTGLVQYNYSIRSLKPIPLTPEILEKNGFENDFYEEESIADYHTIRLEGFSLKHNIGEIDGYLVTWCNGRINVTTDVNGCIQKDISYIHELQHAIRLCGIEKNIEL